MKALLLAGLALSASLPAVSAQRTRLATIVGIVADTNRTPMPDVEVIAIRAGITTITDSKGVFILGGLPEGEEVFRIRRMGYRPETFEAKLVAGDTIRIGVILAPAAFELPELTVEALSVFRERAGLIARGLGRRGWNLIHLTLGDAGLPVPFDRAQPMAMEYSSKAAAPAFESGRSTLRIEVNATVELE